MRGDAPAAAGVLEALLTLDAGEAAGATAHFQRKMQSGGPAFMGQAMGLRTAVTSGNEGEIRALLGECFGLGDAVLDRATAAVRR